MKETPKGGSSRLYTPLRRRGQRGRSDAIIFHIIRTMQAHNPVLAAALEDFGAGSGADASIRALRL